MWLEIRTLSFRQDLMLLHATFPLKMFLKTEFEENIRPCNNKTWNWNLERVKLSTVSLLICSVYLPVSFFFSKEITELIAKILLFYSFLVLWAIVVMWVLLGYVNLFSLLVFPAHLSGWLISQLPPPLVHAACRLILLNTRLFFSKLFRVFKFSLINVFTIIN